MADSMSSQNTSSLDGPNVRKFEGEKSLEEQDVFVSLTYDPLDAQKQVNRVKSAKAGAVVLFAGKDQCFSLTSNSADFCITDS